MAMEISSISIICPKCGTAYSKRKGNFSVCYGDMYKGTGYLSVCKQCVDKMFTGYLSQGKNTQEAMRALCRKLDLYWSPKIFDSVERKSVTKTLVTNYLSRITALSYSGKSYETTLEEENTFWNFDDEQTKPKIDGQSMSGGDAILGNEDDTSTVPLSDIDEEIIAYWGTGYTGDMYQDLEKRRKYWMSKLPSDKEMDIGTEVIIKQICSLELDINRDRAAGKPVDKSINVLNTLLGSGNFKPVQKKQDEADLDIEKTPMGVWAQRFENERPIPEVDPELEDVDGIVKYISVWFLGHLCKMLHIKNSYSQLYEDEMARLKVDRPEFEEEDDEAVFYDIFGNNNEDGDTANGEV